MEQKTLISFRSIADYESFFNTIDSAGYDSDDAVFTGCSYKLSTFEFIRVNRSEYGRGTDIEQDNVEYTGNNCYIPTGGKCFKKFFKYLTAIGYMNNFLTFIRDEQRRLIVLTSARVQPFCKKHIINICC